MVDYHGSATAEDLVSSDMAAANHSVYVFSGVLALEIYPWLKMLGCTVPKIGIASIDVNCRQVRGPTSDTPL